MGVLALDETEKQVNSRPDPLGWIDTSCGLPWHEIARKDGRLVLLHIDGSECGESEYDLRELMQ